MTLDQSEPSLIPALSAHTNLSMTVLNTIPFGIGEDRALQYFARLLLAICRSGRFCSRW
jgi:hypothetical protein